MTRQILHRVLLSLVLLLSQQMAFGHALSHWTGTLGGEAAQQHHGAGSLSAAVAQDQTCDHCLALAQLAAPLGSSNRTFVAGDNAGASRATLATQRPGAPAIRGFNPRAPPQA